MTVKPDPQQAASDEALLAEHEAHPERFRKLPDLVKVEAFIAAVELKKRAPDHRTYPPPPSPPAADSAIRKPLRAHGDVCPGFHSLQIEPQ